MAYSDAAAVDDAAEEARFAEIAHRRAANPAEYFAGLRAQGPLAVGQNPRREVEILNRADVEAVLRDTEVWSNALPLMGSAEPVIPVGLDPPAHAEYRRLLDPAFSPRRMAALAPNVAAHANRLIDAFIETGSVDFSQALAVPLPCSTFLDLLGIDQSELPRLLYWKDVMIHPAQLAGGFEAGQRLAAETAPVIYEYLYQTISERRGKPGDDVISRLLEARMENDRALSDNEIARCLFQLIAAGLDTVSISLECIFTYLATHPGDRQMIVDDPETITNLIEELLRWESPVQPAVPRLATRDTEIAGCPIKAGTVVSPLVAAANLDPAVPGADRVDVRRGDKRHLAFGGGPHRCLGSHLARMELRVAVREWHKRIPQYGLKEGYEVEWNDSRLRGVDHLQLQWDPSTTVARESA
jgi:cytochrome P450